MNAILRMALGVNLASVLKAMKHGIANLNVAASQSYLAARAAHLDSVTESQLDAMPALPLDDILQLLGGPRPSIRLTISKT